MITKEQETKKYCCFYVSDFHLEMILLPYIKDNIDKTKFIIFTEKDLSESMKILLDRTNLDCDEKNTILGLDWNHKEITDISHYGFNHYTIIINGSNDYILKTNEIIRKMGYPKINIIDCYSMDEKSLQVMQIKEKYNGILNTKKL